MYSSQKYLFPQLDVAYCLPGITNAIADLFQNKQHWLFILYMIRPFYKICFLITWNFYDREF